MAVATNVVNLDALIKRADLAAPGEQGEDITSLSVIGLETRGMLFPALRKPDFQRETANWTPEQVADLVVTFAKRDLIPAVILWRAGQDVFVIDGAHRLSALIAWVHDDYGDGEVSRRHYQNFIPDEQKRAASRARDLINAAIGSFQDHKIAIDHPGNSRADIVERAARIAWQEIPAQWIRNADHDKAEKAFFRINQGGTKIDTTERRILAARRSATAFAARAIIRGGTGHSYWKTFDDDVGKTIEDLGGDIHRLLFEPVIQLPVKTLDVPMAGHGYGPKVLPFVFDLVNLLNKVQVKDSSYKRLEAGDNLGTDETGDATIGYLKVVKRMIQRICSNDASSLGLHPALYFYTRGGVFQSASLLSYALLFQEWATEDFRKFTTIRSEFEEYILNNRAVTEAISKLGTGARSRPRVVLFYKKLIEGLLQGKTAKQVQSELSLDPDFSFLVDSNHVSGELFSSGDGSFSRDVKGAAYLKDALATAPRCPTCGGLMHRNGMQVGHILARRDGGAADLANAMMQHPFCNSTFAN